MIGSILTHIGSGNTTEIDAALDILLGLVDRNPHNLIPYTAFIKGILDFVYGLEDVQVRKSFQIFSALSFGDAPVEDIDLGIDNCGGTNLIRFAIFSTSQKSSTDNWSWYAHFHVRRIGDPHPEVIISHKCHLQTNWNYGRCCHDQENFIQAGLKADSQPGSDFLHSANIRQNSRMLSEIQRKRYCWLT